MSKTTYREDVISRADAIGAVDRILNGKAYWEDILDIKDVLSALPSAEAEPTVIRSRTFMPTKDFMEWAKRIREVNPNAVVIPCDAEVASAEAVQGEWIETSEGTMCGNCHKFPYDDGEYHIANWHSDFCPNCGARMEGGEDKCRQKTGK